MNLTKYDYLKKIVKQTLSKLKSNNMLDEMEASREYKAIKEEIKDFMISQVEKVVVKELIEQAFLLTRKADTNPQIMEMVEREINSVSPTRYFIDIFVQTLSKAEQIAGQDAVDNLGVNLIYKVSKGDHIRDRLNRLFPVINSTTAKQISQQIEYSKENFLTLEETIDYVLQKSRENIKNRANIIAENEVATIMGETQHNVYKKSGVFQLKWVTAADDRVCPICAPLDGKIVNINGVFVGGQGMTTQSPPIHISCRCYVIPEERLGTQVWTGQ